MISKDIYADLHPRFKDLSDTKYMHDLPEEWLEPNTRYVRVLSSTKKHPNNIKYYHSLGYRLVTIPGSEKQSHANSVKEKANVWPDPIRVISDTGQESYWMCISEKDFAELKKKQDDEQTSWICKNSKRTETPTEIREVSKEIIDFNNFSATPETDI